MLDEQNPFPYLYAIYQRTLPLGRDETNLKANHNKFVTASGAVLSVCNLSKNTIWKQITTKGRASYHRVNLYAIYQRTQSESKSQLTSFVSPCIEICMQSIKEHNLKANHNKGRNWFYTVESVCNLSKNTIWKQITTALFSINNLTVLYAIYQRTQSESKSQRVWNYVCITRICMQSIKEHNLKANHNLYNQKRHKLLSVCNLSKNTIWKQITTSFRRWCLSTNLYAIYQRTQSESKSQQLVACKRRNSICMQSIKEHNLKANHNWGWSTQSQPRSIKEHNLKANHNYTSNSWHSNTSVCNLSKNTIWKQITTVAFRYREHDSLYAIYQRTQSESKSQLSLPVKLYQSSVCNLSKNTIWKQITTSSVNTIDLIICMQSIKEHNLKANHNSTSARIESICLYAIYQRTQSESKSQLGFIGVAHYGICMQSIKEHSR